MAWLFLAAATPSACAFSMLGPGEEWQDTTIGYEKFVYVTLPASGWIIHGDDFAWHPHNLGEESRWNTPVLYYSFDQSFLDYFGASGVAAVDAAMAVFNNLPRVSDANLNDFPLEESRINYTAQALHLFDLKSTAMELVIERLGLIDPENWTWCIRNRILPPSLSCPQFDFLVVQRNFDPVTWQPSRYVNGTLFTYEIQQICEPYDFGDAVEFLVDPNAEASARYSALATPKLALPDETFYGWFHTGLTRDDMGGLRYLYATNNMNIEAAGTNTITFITDTNATQLLYTSNLTLLASQALTNNPAALQALYPNLSIASTKNIFTNIYVTNLTALFTNYPFDPLGTPPHLEFVTNLTLTVQNWYHHTFNNVFKFQWVTNQQYPNGVWTTVPLSDIVLHTNLSLITVLTTTVTNPPYTPVGSPLITNTTTRTYLTNQVVGNYFIAPTNACGVSVLYLQATVTNYNTNILVSATNTPAGFTNTQSFEQVVIDSWVQDVFVVNPVICATNSVALRQGIEKITFIRRDFDSLLGQFFSPVTNNYSLTAVTNYNLYPPSTNFIRQQVQRVVTQPDILFTASDLAGGFPAMPTVVRSTPAFDLTGQQPTLAGPGVIREQVTFTFNKVGPMYVNGTYPLFVDEAGALLHFAWASYDATTNAPIIYPNGTSIADLENQVLIQVSPPYLPDATITMPYSVQLQTSAATPNWQTPVTWSLAPGSPPLPPGFNPISSGGLISGTPSQVGFFNFIIQATDAAGRTVQQSYVINVAPYP